jgi:hypothetical protein
MKQIQGLVKYFPLVAVVAIAAIPASVSAQCVMADVAVQAAIHGSRQPAQQSNDVEMQSSGPCRGNTSVNTSKQVQVGGTGPVVQERRSRHQLENEGDGPAGPTVAVPVGVQVDVYNPAEQLRPQR